MVRAIIFFVVFSIASTAPLLNDARNDLRNNIDINSLTNSFNEENEIADEKLFKAGTDEKYGGLIIGSNDKKDNSDEAESFNINDSDDDLNNNYIDIDDRTKQDSKLSVFVSVLLEFLKSIAEQIMTIYKR